MKTKKTDKIASQEPRRDKEVMSEVAALIGKELDFPDIFIFETKDGGNLSFGWVNGPLGWDLEVRGVQVDAGILPHREFHSAQEQASYIRDICEKFGVTIEQKVDDEHAEMEMEKVEKLLGVEAENTGGNVYCFVFKLDEKREVYFGYACGPLGFSVVVDGGESFVGGAMQENDYHSAEGQVAYIKAVLAALGKPWEEVIKSCPDCGKATHSEKDVNGFAWSVCACGWSEPEDGCGSHVTGDEGGK